jgi:hypothetical protein
MGKEMNKHDKAYQSQMWTIAKDSVDGPEVFFWENIDCLAVFLFSKKEIAEHTAKQLGLRGYRPLAILTLKAIIDMIESLAEEGVGYVATNPGEKGPIVIPIYEVIKQLRLLDERASKS